MTELPIDIMHMTPTEFEGTINELWYQRGCIDTAYELLGESPFVDTEFSKNFSLTRKRIEGYYRLKHNGVLFPERASGCVYIPEPKRAMYCVHSTPVFNSNGYSTRTRGLLSALQNQGWDVVSVARAGYPWDYATDKKAPQKKRHVETLDGVDYVHIPGPSLVRDSIDRYFLESADAFVREAKLSRPSIIHSASNFQTAIPALMAARRVGVPFVYEVRGLWEITAASKKEGFLDSEYFALMRDMETLVANEADHVLAITDEVREELVKRGVNPEKISILPNAVNHQQFMPLVKDEVFAKKHHIDLTKPVIGFFGSIVEYEGLEALIHASAELTRKQIPHQVVIAGSGESLDSLKNLREEISAHDVMFLGRLPQSDIPRLLSMTDITVYPRLSTMVTEMVSPLKPLESFALAVPSILSDVAPHRVLAGEDQERALLVPPSSSKALAEALEALIYNADKRRDMGRAGRLWVVRERNWDTLACTVLERYKDASAFYTENARATRTLKDIRVAVIADEFTTSTLATSMSVVSLDRECWREEMESNDFDFVLIESAWSGNGGQWARGVGYYSEEEFADLRSLLEYARHHNIPTVFWNKEDPVHWNRFSKTAQHCDYVFTTDANTIPRYLSISGNTIKSVSSLPFYASPALHNPLLGSGAIKEKYAYAGTYYGERYAERTQALTKVLDAALEFGLDIFDRQLNLSDSPYHFPEKYADNVQGGIPYEETIQAYKTYLAHINVNSVTNSPTMFSRRCVEIPACGGIVVTPWARSIPETLGLTIACSNDPLVYQALFYDWAHHPQSRLAEVWLQMRSIYRSHTANTELAILCRSLGIPARGVSLPRAIVHMDHLSSDNAKDLARQSVLPTAVCAHTYDPECTAILSDAGIVLSDASQSGNSEGEVNVHISSDIRMTRTFIEDFLLPYRFLSELSVTLRCVTDDDGFLPSISLDAEGTGVGDNAFAHAENTSPTAQSVVVNYPFPLVREAHDVAEADSAQESVQEVPEKRTVLFAGHDFKFAEPLIRAIEERGHRVLIDTWQDHTHHDEEQSRSFLEEADIVFCEWGLGNLVFYSNNRQPHQKLYARIHAQEFNLPYLKQHRPPAVDGYFFVSERMRTSAVKLKYAQQNKTFVCPNFVDTELLKREKADNAEFAVGMVGIVPQSKRFDLALDLIELLQEKDSRYFLRIKGKTPDDYPWMKDRPQELAYYTAQMKRVEALNARQPNSVIFDGWGSDMPEWYQQVGTVISVSDHESFHLSIADGAASGACPISLAWDGADLIYPDSWLVSSIEEMADAIVNKPKQMESYQVFVQDNFDQKLVLKQMLATMGL